jgi:hypothetical protein
LDNIRLDRCEDAILQLYPVKMALSTFIEQVRPLVHCLLHGTEDERDHRGKKNHVGGHRGGISSWVSDMPRCGSHGDVSKIGLHSQGGPMKALHSDDHQKSSLAGEASNMARHRHLSEDETSISSFPMELRPGSLEEVLDNWTHNAEEMMADATELSQSMDDAIRFLEASMSCMRNRLLTLELGTEVTALVFALGALVSGIFGMNLHTGIEDTPGYFFIVVFFIMGCGAMIVGFALWVIWRSKRHYQNHSARFGNNMFFRSFGDDVYILRDLGTRITESGTLPEDVLNRVLEDLRKPALPVQDSSSRRHRLSQSVENFGSFPSVARRASGISSPTIAGPHRRSNLGGSNISLLTGGTATS